MGLLTLTVHASNTISVRDIQLLLALEGYELDAKKVDGKLGAVTKQSIKDYRKKKNLPVANDNELIDDVLFNSLYEDTYSKFFSSRNGGQSGDQDNNGKSLDVYASAIAAIYAARHSTEETKDFYELFTKIFSGALTFLALGGAVFGYKSLRDVKSDLRDEIKKEIDSEKASLSQLNEKHQGTINRLDNLSHQLEEKINALDETVEEKNKALEEMVEEKIKELVDNGHANISASSIACSANISVNMYLYAKEFGWKGGMNQKVFLDEADKLCRRALELNPQDSRILSWLYGMQGIIFGEQNKLSESCEAFKKALDNDPDNVKTLCNAACGFALSKRNAEALEFLQKAVKIQPSICEWAKTETLLDNIKIDPNFPCR